MKLPLSLLGLFFLTGNCAYATPTVIGNTIHWPDEGWYQVQSVNVSGIHEVCAGGTSCNVTAGEYIVINHTTGERFIEIMVASLTHPVEPESPIVVSGNTISWPDNGWYQVQNEIDFSESCSGVRSCEVVPGSYVVINHSTGIRYSGIEVESEGGDEIEPPTPLVVEVDEFTISWSDNGWYQAQNASGSSTICEGTRSCDVPPGEYIVINHTTGQRVEGVIVSEPSSQIEDNE
jgi:hypothetical protein